MTIQQTGPDPAIAGSNFSLVCDVKPAIHVVNVSWSFTNTLSIPSIPGEENFQFLGESGEILMIKHVKECYRNVQIACVAIDVLNVKKSSNSYSLFVVGKFFSVIHAVILINNGICIISSCENNI